jgi:PAS domain S-box-containing protein
MKSKENPDRHESGVVLSASESPFFKGVIPTSVETFLIDEDGVLTASKGFDLASFGSRPGPASGLSVFDLFSDEPTLLKNIERALNGEQVTTETTADGITYSTTLTPVLDGHGKVKSVIGVSYDITESKKAPEIIRKSEFRLRTLFNSAHDAIFTMDNKTFIDCNEATLRIFQCTKDQIVGQTPYRYSPLRQPDGRLSEEAAMERINAVLDGKPQFFEWQHIRYDGTPFDAEVSLNRLDLEGEVQIQAIVRDVSERKKAEEENRQLAMVANITTNMVILASNEGRIEWVNPAFTRVTGYTLEEVIGRKPGSFLQGPDSDKKVADFIRSRFNARLGFKDVEIINYKKDGSPFWASIEVQPIVDKTGKVVQFVAMESDITERMLTSKALMDRNEDLLKINAELDRFVYSASHDLRAPISSLLGLIEVARLEKDMGNMEKLLDMQKKSLLRLDHFIKDIVDHSRNTRLKIEPSSINFASMVNASFEQLQFMDNVSRIKRTITIEQDGTIYTAATRLEIILKNLISNAVKYADLRKENPYLHVQVKADRAYAEISIKDNGEGIPEDARPKIFDMFYRASSNGTGSGLGLYIVKEAIQKIGGNIRVDSEYGSGTEFTVRIPNMEAVTAST